MESDKSRGLKHIKDKRKYKGNSTKNPKYVPPKTKPNLESNWYRYEDEEITDDNNLPTADTDYNILANAPISKGKHFQSKTDKLLASETESTDLSGLFTLNLEKLEESLMAIPFYKRMGIDEKYFFENQINVMNNEAEEYLNRIAEQNKTKIPVEPTTKTNEELKPDIKETSLDVNVKNSEETKENQELEKWLDDFLND